LKPNLESNSKNRQIANFRVIITGATRGSVHPSLL
jgi:hypothetical protein